jgi:hypothetical protein
MIFYVFLGSVNQQPGKRAHTRYPGRPLQLNRPTVPLNIVGEAVEANVHAVDGPVGVLEHHNVGLQITDLWENFSTYRRLECPCQLDLPKLRAGRLETHNCWLEVSALQITLCYFGARRQRNARASGCAMLSQDLCRIASQIESRILGRHCLKGKEVIAMIILI